MMSMGDDSRTNAVTVLAELQLPMSLSMLVSFYVGTDGPCGEPSAGTFPTWRIARHPALVFCQAEKEQGDGAIYLLEPIRPELNEMLVAASIGNHRRCAVDDLYHSSHRIGLDVATSPHRFIVRIVT